MLQLNEMRGVRVIRTELCTIVSHRKIAYCIYELTLKGEMATKMTDPGQFVHVKVNDQLVPLLRRPISIAKIDRDLQEFTLIYRAAGKGTKILSEKRVGDQLDVLGPLGHGFPLEAVNEGETALLVGGGIGVPPLYELSSQLAKKGVNIIHVLGFETKDVVFYEERFKQLGQVFVATADGTYGTKGFVTKVIAAESIDFDVLFSCGPLPMLRALEVAYANEKQVYLSLEERMACGLGACFACVCHTTDDPNGHSYKKVCHDGPVFKAGEVVL